MTDEPSPCHTQEGQHMELGKVKIRQRLLRAFTVVLFFSFALTGTILSVVMRFAAITGDGYLGVYQDLGRVQNTQLVLVIVMFIVAVIVTYFLSNSLTKPIEKLGKFALELGKGNFTPNDYKFREYELEELNSALNKAAKQLGEYDSEQRKFFQNVSHELRTPLTSIKCYAEGITFGIMDPKKAGETISKESDKLADMVTNLLYIAKMDNVLTAYKKTQTDLIKLIKECAERQNAIAAKEEITLKCDFDEDEIPYNCIDELMSRAVDNLLSNAIRYAKTTVTLSCKKEANKIIIKVTDDGEGIKEEDLPHVFERFYKGKGGNIGIGLSIVKSIADQHSAKIEVKNEEQGGASFEIIL